MTISADGARMAGNRARKNERGLGGVEVGGGEPSVFWTQENPKIQILEEVQVEVRKSSSGFLFRPLGWTLDWTPVPEKLLGYVEDRWVGPNRAVLGSMSHNSLQDDDFGYYSRLLARIQGNAMRLRNNLPWWRRSDYLLDEINHNAQIIRNMMTEKLVKHD